MWNEQHPSVQNGGTVAAFVAPRGRDPAGERLLAIVARERRVPVDMLLHRSRCRADIALARQLAMYVMHVALQRQYSEVGRFFGRDRTTVWHACALIEDLREDVAFDAEVDRLEQAVAGMDVPLEQRHAG